MSFEAQKLLLLIVLLSMLRLTGLPPASVVTSWVLPGDWVSSNRRIELGNLDPDSLVDWTQIPASVIACQEHKQLARQMGREQMVLLKNNGILPLRVNDFKNHPSKLMVMGPPWRHVGRRTRWIEWIRRKEHYRGPLFGELEC